MNFLPIDICEKLVEKGCVSESGYFYQEYCGRIIPVNEENEFTCVGKPAFIFQDFCGISEQAKNNTVLLWGITPRGSEEQKEKWERSRFTSQSSSERFVRRVMLDITWDEWVEFMRKTVGL